MSSKVPVSAQVFRSPFILLATLLPVAHSTVVEEFTGYVVDNLCWDRPNHVGIDNSQLGTAPETHWLHCMLLAGCKASGFAMLERLSSPASDGAVYGPKYQLDDAGDALVIELAEAEVARAGDRLFNEQVTVTGAVSGSEMAVTSLCITPVEQNPSNETICYSPPNADEAAPRQLALAAVALALVSFVGAATVA